MYNTGNDLTQSSRLSPSGHVKGGTVLWVGWCLRCRRTHDILLAYLHGHILHLPLLLVQFPGIVYPANGCIRQKWGAAVFMSLWDRFLIWCERETLVACGSLNKNVKACAWDKTRPVRPDTGIQIQSQNPTPTEFIHSGNDCHFVIKYKICNYCRSSQCCNDLVPFKLIVETYVNLLTERG